MPPLNSFTRSCLALAIGQAVVAPAQAANIVVDNIGDISADDALCTLREAIVSANTNPASNTSGCTAGTAGLDTISFNIYGGYSIYAFQPTALHITDDLEINGPDQGSLTIHATNNSGVFSVIGATVYFNNLTITGGAAYTYFYQGEPPQDDFLGGGGIYVSAGSVSLTNVTVSGNSASVGGGIRLRDGASANLVNSSVSGNRVSFYGGGGIAVRDSNLILTGTTVSSNFFDGISSFGSDVNITGGKVSDNTYSGIYAVNSSIGLTSSTVSGNNFRGLNLRGVTATLANSSVSDNIQSFQFDAAGIDAYDSSVTLTNSTVSGNSTGWSGGGIKADQSHIVVNNSTVSANFAGRDGGGIELVDSTLTAINSTMSGNQAGYNSLSDEGGAIKIDRSVASLNNTTIANNTAFRGGGIFVATDSQVSLTNNIISGNSASTGADIMKAFNSNSTFPTTLNNVIGDSSKSSSGSFVFFTLGVTDITATSNGLLPTQLSSIISPLAANGGPNQTHALPRGSPAIDSGDNALCPAKDQRGESRSDEKCDIGAYELVGESCFVVKAVNGNTIVFCL